MNLQMWTLEWLIERILGGLSEKTTIKTCRIPLKGLRKKATNWTLRERICSRHGKNTFLHNQDLCRNTFYPTKKCKSPKELLKHLNLHQNFGILKKNATNKCINENWKKGEEKIWQFAYILQKQLKFYKTIGCAVFHLWLLDILIERTMRTMRTMRYQQQA